MIAGIAWSCGPSYRDIQSEYRRGNLPEVIRLAKAGALRQTKQDSPAYWQFRLLEAEALTDQGKRDEALALIKDPVPPALRQLEVRRLIDLAALDVRDPKIALPFLDRAESQVSDQDLRIRITDLRGIALFLSGEHASGEAKVHEALDLATKAGEDFYAARSLSTLGYFAKVENDYIAAVNLGERAVSLAAKVGADRVKARALVNLGGYYLYLGDDRAIESEQAAIDIFTRIQDRENLVDAIGEKGLALYTLREHEDAIPLYKRALDVAKDDFPDARKRICANLALDYLELGNVDEGEKWNRLAQPEKGPAPFVLMNDADIALKRGQREVFFRLAHEVASLARLDGLKWRVHGTMAHEYTRESDFKNARLEYDQAREVFEHQRAGQKDIRVRISFLSRLIALYQGYVEMLVLQKRPDEALLFTERSRAQVLADRFGRTDTKAIRPPTPTSNTVLLSFWIAPNNSYLWVISSKGTQRIDLPEGEKKVKRAVEDYKKLIEIDYKDPLTMKSQSPLWHMLLEQAAPLIPQGSRVVVIPDGPLHQLNLETLVVPGTSPHYWLKDVEVVVAPSLALAPSFTAEPPHVPASGGPKLLLIGAPDAEPNYPALRNADPELQDIRKKFQNPSPSMIEGPKATPAAYFGSQPEQFAMIHFAAHADADQDNPLESAVILSKGAEGNYRLYARDVYQSSVPLRANLVTVSACRSAGARSYSGEGLIGFAWAFLASGARNVIAGLWDVDDKSSSTLMSSLYDGISHGQDPVRALHEAKVKLMDSNTEPYYWAPLQIYSASK